MPKSVKNQRHKRHYIFFIIVLFIFVMMASTMNPLNLLSTYGDLFGLAAAILLITYSALYFLDIKGKKDYSLTLDTLFLLSLLNFILMFIYTGPLTGIIISSTLNDIYVVVIGILTIIMLSFPLFLGTYFFRNKKFVWLACILFIIVAAIVFYFFFSGIFIKSYVIDDEFFISLKDIKYLLEGINPYRYSVADQVYFNNSILGFSFATNGAVVGILSYPALYLFSYLPFYFVAAPTIYNMEHYIAPLQSAFFFMILLFAIAFSIDKKYLKSPVFGLLIFLAALFANIGSLTVFLMLALLVIAYKNMGKKYSWLFLGLCLAIQELIWVPVILLFAYSINNYGLKKGLQDIIGAAVVFLIINSYFIAIGPAAFFSAIFNPIQQLLLPIGNGFFGFLLLASYHTLLSTYSAIFGIVILLMVIAYLYINDKVFVGLLSIIPFLFLARSLTYYYALFVTFLFITLFISEKKTKQGIVEGYLHKRKEVLILVVLVLMAALFFIVYSSHVKYQKGFDLSVSNQSIYYNTSTSQNMYRGTLHYNSLESNQIYIMFYGASSSSFNKIGISNQSIISNSLVCASNEVSCLVNVNRITLNGSSGSYTIKAYLGKSNVTQKVDDVRIYVYYGNYFYAADAVSNTIK